MKDAAEDTPQPDDLDDILGDEPQAVREALKRRIKTEGVQVAYDAMLDVCRSKTAPAPARATAASTIFRAAGYLGKAADEDSDTTPIDQMTADQLAKELRRIQDRRVALQASGSGRRGRRSSKGQSDSGVFG